MSKSGISISGNRKAMVLMMPIPVTWSAFQTIRLAWHNSAKIEHLTPSGLIKPFTDASDYAIGAHLVQLNEEGRKGPISFASQLLIKPKDC